MIDAHLLTVTEAAERLRLSPATVYALVSAKKLTHQRVGVGRGKIVVPMSAITEYLAKATVRSEEAPPGAATVDNLLASWRIRKAK